MEIINGWRAQIKTRILPAYREALAQSGSRDSAVVLEDDWWEVLSTALGAASLVLQLLAQRARPRITIWALFVRTDYSKRWASAVNAQTGVDPSIHMDPNALTGAQGVAAESVAASVETTAQTVGATVTAQVWSALTAKTPVSDLEKALLATVGKAAARVPYYEKANTSKYVGELERLIENEASMLKYTWYHTPQEHPREYHVRRAGHVFSWARPPWDGPPGTQPNCKCKARPILVLDVDPPVSHIGQDKRKGD
jgi:uncharacterized protein with gpF-like domain